MTKTVGLPVQTVQIITCIALLIATPFYIFFGYLSDRIGRRPVMLASYVLGAVTIIPIFWGITHYGNPKLGEFLEHNPIVVTAHSCNFRVFAAPASECDKVASQLTDFGLSFRTVSAPVGTLTQVTIAGRPVAAIDRESLRSALSAAGWQPRADLASANLVAVTLLVTLLDIFTAMVFAPIGAFMAELFPARLRYTSMSLPFQLGAGWIGGLLPFVVAALSVYFGSVYAGLWYPVVVAALAALIGYFTMPETYKVKL